MSILDSPEKLAFYRENGYLMVENYLSSEEIESLRESAHQIVEDFDANTLSVFTTEEQSQHFCAAFG
jgi:phytanoyl-CoA hydroxylase